jgi:alanyl-tRNA synthetase
MGLCQEQLRKVKKKQGEENIQKAIKTATDIAEAAVAEGKPFCVARLDVGLDTTATREAVVKVIDKLVCISNVWFESIFTF